MNITRISLIALLLSCVWSVKLLAQEQQTSIFIEWKEGPAAGNIDVANGVVKSMKIVKGKGKVSNNRFSFASRGNVRLAIELEGVHNQAGPGATIVAVKTATNGFSFFLRDITQEFPVYIPGYQVVVLPGTDQRSYAAVAESIADKKLQTKVQRIEADPETSFASVEKKVLNQSVPIWLGVSRDFRIFELTESLPDMPREWNTISPRYSTTPVTIEESKNAAVTYGFNAGRGVGVYLNTTRRLEEGVLPMLHSTQTDDDVKYDCTAFVALEQSPLTMSNVAGTHYLVADNYSGGHMFTNAQEQMVKERLKNAFNNKEETVFYYKAEVTNTGKAPRYAWFKTPRPGGGWWQKTPYNFDPVTGFSAYSADRVFCVSKLNGQPLPNEEMAVLLQPNEKAVFEFYLPHIPVSNQRAKNLFQQSFAGKMDECRNFWNGKLAQAAKVSVPEKRINEMIQAGLLHLDLITYGKEPDSTLAPNIGVYSPIGTESAPIIQFYASMGLKDMARRSLNYFLDKQHEDGFIQNFGGYMVETGAALWSMGEYYRYTHDKEWVTQQKAKIIKSCDYLLNWRNKNKTDSLKGRGYGLIDGKVADPEDHFHQFMLNGYAYLGLNRIAEILVEIDPASAARIRKEADAWKKDLRESFFNALALSPVVPLGDGTWSPTAPPWTETRGLRSLYLKNEAFFSHGTFTVSDAMLGPLYLVFCEVLDVKEPAAQMLLNYHRELFFQNNAAFSQPYYSRHNWVQAIQGDTKPFLSTYYSTFAALADRDTYTFWEHLYKVSVHKTHEEAWFLMETRWMLYMENGNTLKLLNTVPRTWLENGKSIALTNVQSYFGPISLQVNSSTDKGFIEATVQCDTDRKPGEVLLRIPHPLHKKPVKVTGGDYDPQTETVHIKSFAGTAKVMLQY